MLETKTESEIPLSSQQQQRNVIFLCVSKGKESGWSLVEPCLVGSSAVYGGSSFLVCPSSFSSLLFGQLTKGPEKRVAVIMVRPLFPGNQN